MYVKHVEKYLAQIKHSVNYSYYYMSELFYSLPISRYKLQINLEDVTLYAQIWK